MLLFDQNLSPALVSALQDCFPGAVHVQSVGLAEASDRAIWSYAIEREFAIVTKDGDFRQRSFLEGYPPKIIWLALGNCSTEMIERALRSRRLEIENFLNSEQSSFLSLT